MNEGAAPIDRGLARAQSLVGLLGLLALVIDHLLRLWPVLAGREAWLRARITDTAAFGLLPWAGLLAAHAVLGVVRVARVKGSQLDPDARGLRRLQALTGIIIALFVGRHVVQLAGLAGGAAGSSRAQYAALWDSLGRPLELGIYLIGISALCFHLGHGVSRAAETWGLLRGSQAKLLARVCGGAIGFGLWALWLQVLAHFALGGPLF